MNISDKGHVFTQQPAKTHISQLNSQVKAQVLSLLKEIIQDEFADKVWVESVVYDFCPAKLKEKWGDQR